MEKFIDKIVEEIVQKDLALEHLVVVLPSERAKKYLQSSLFKAYQKPIFSPKIITINRWITELSPLPIIDSTRALFKLYDIHKQVDTEETQSLDEFLKWGRILMSDFDEIDRYLIDSKDLFKNLSDIKDIENWSFGEPEKITESQKKFMRFWELLQDYYVEFNKKLEKDGECYMGKAYKTVAENIDLVFKKDKSARFIFAGFNALSPAEISVIKQLHVMGKADIYIDADEFYLNDKNHEAGSFIRNLMSELKVKTLPFIIDKLTKDEKEITIVNCAQPTGQAKVSATILEEQIPAGEFSETLLLLANESLIVPVIKNIPRKVMEANITLGLPLKNTAIKSWVDLLFSTQEHFQQFKTQQIYHRDFIRFIKHPFITGFCSYEEQMEITKVEQNILSNNWTFIFKKNLEVSERLHQLIELFFTPWKRTSEEYPLEHIRQLNQTIFEGLDRKKNEIERSIIFHLDKSLIRLENVLEEFKPDINLGTFKSLFNQHWINESVAYYGNPLDGIQVMGLLETRLLDFKNIIVVGLNDGNMPPTNPIQSMIMMDLRRYFNLPTPREKQGLFAHHFYRLLHHAEKTWITYSSANREMGGMDEPSRYIMQLELELARSNPQLKIHKMDYTLSSEEEKSSTVIVEKTPAIIERLDNYFSNRTSVSALKTYMTCHLDFYYKYLLGLGQEDKVEEEVEASTFGSFIHETLEELYGPFALLDEKGNKKEGKQRLLSSVDVDQMIVRQKDIMNTHFMKRFHYEQNPEGKNFLGLEIASHLTEQFLKKERDSLKKEGNHLFIDALELKVIKELKLNIRNEEKIIRFIGIMDRIDEFEGGKRILDYKSGKCTDEDVKIKGLKPGASEDDKIASLANSMQRQRHTFQLLVYIMLFHEKFGYYPDKVGIVSMINLNDSPFYLNNQLTDSTEELMDLFVKALTLFIEDIYDTGVPFTHTASSFFNYCDYCLV